jgi:predicted secreted hydrolase
MRALKRADFELAIQSTWRSPHSGAVYPAAWTVNIPSEGLNLQVRPLIPDQELNVSIVYWEGAVQITGMRSGAAINGFGYVELTGYASSMKGRF